MVLVYRSRGERPLASLGKSQNLVALELGKAFNDGLGQSPHGSPLAFQCVPDLVRVLLPPHGAAPAWGTTADAATWGGVAPVRGHPTILAETAPTVAPLSAAVAEEVLLELVTPHGAATDPAWGHLAHSLHHWGSLAPTWALGFLCRCWGQS